MEDKEPLHIYYDGDCGVCSRIKKRLERRFGLQLAFHDIRRGELPPNVTLQTAIQDVHAFDGVRLEKGGDVVFALLERSQKWRWLARARNLPPLRWLVRWSYRLFANNRRLLSRIL